MKDNATCSDTAQWRNLLRPAPLRAEAFEIFITSATSEFVALRAGSKPILSMASNSMPSRKKYVGQSKLRLSGIGAGPFEAQRSSNGPVAAAINRLKTPPHAARTPHSTTNC